MKKRHKKSDNIVLYACIEPNGKIHVPVTGEWFVNEASLPNEEELKQLIMDGIKGYRNIVAKAISKRLRGE